MILVKGCMILHVTTESCLSLQCLLSRDHRAADAPLGTLCYRGQLSRYAGIWGFPGKYFSYLFRSTREAAVKPGFAVRGRVSFGSHPDDLRLSDRRELGI